MSSKLSRLECEMVKLPMDDVGLLLTRAASFDLSYIGGGYTLM